MVGGASIAIATMIYQFFAMIRIGAGTSGQCSRGVSPGKNCL